MGVGHGDAQKSYDFRLTPELVRHLEQVEDEFALPSRNAALCFILKRDLKAHPSKGRDPGER